MKNGSGEVRVGGDELDEEAETSTIVGSSVERKDYVRVVNRKGRSRGRGRRCSFEEEGNVTRCYSAEGDVSTSSIKTR